MGGCRTGQAKITKGYGLPCKYVIHTVGPVWRGGGQGERLLLLDCYRNSLELAKAKGCETVAFPLISAGAYGYPKAQALQAAVDAITAFLLANDMTVYIVVFNKEAFELSGKLFSDVVAYIDDVYVDQHLDPRREAMGRLDRQDNRPFTAPEPWEDAPLMAAAPPPQQKADPPAGLEDMLSQVEEGFGQTLLRLIDQKGISDSDCYKKANIDRRLFNKIKNNPAYKPSKQTALAFVIALELNLEQAKDMLSRAGFALSHSNKEDIVVEYCIRTGTYDIIQINQVLFKLDLQPWATDSPPGRGPRALDEREPLLQRAVFPPTPSVGLVGAWDAGPRPGADGALLPGTFVSRQATTAPAFARAEPAQDKGARFRARLEK